MMNGFCWYELRTTDTGAAQAFYVDVLGFRMRDNLFFRGDRPVAGCSPLPERAAARGAPAHWLGHIAVRDVESLSHRILAQGGEQLGPTRTLESGATRVILRDPFGSVLSLVSSSDTTSGDVVVWHDLNTRDHARAFAFYSDLFGWKATETVDFGPEFGAYLKFSWDEGGPSVGGMVSSARLPHVHPHWLFYFHVEDLDEALAKVSARGGKVLAPRELPNGDRVAVCDDPQGAAFALHASAARA
ncbi:VOC family protein [Polyangium jinanense]|uniref:VOC family protein n=1 Tax=Polyangium jinanense TaxID=2829994 RepID=A0A9X4AXX6_9BACT|nr:VOC family protein [Polyangium jinanense]MDC3958389.1 VOC family protein [Polyangium jinanense]MDC3988281.1 VOC family protein [Polyangium jinanense]